MKSYRTSIMGLCAIVAAIAGAASALIDGDPKTTPDWTTISAAISAGIGLIAARDNKVTSEQAGAK